MQIMQNIFTFETAQKNVHWQVSSEVKKNVVR